jgi:hypothetical protein
MLNIDDANEMVQLVGNKEETRRRPSRNTSRVVKKRRGANAIGKATIHKADTRGVASDVERRPRAKVCPANEVVVAVRDN